MVVSIAGTTATAHPIKMSNAEGETVQIFTTDGAGNIMTGGMLFFLYQNGISIHIVARNELSSKETTFYLKLILHQCGPEWPHIILRCNELCLPRVVSILMCCAVQKIRNW